MIAIGVCRRQLWSIYDERLIAVTSKSLSSRRRAG